MSLATELKLLGVEKPTKEQMQKIRNAVMKEHQRKKILPFMLNDELKITMYIVLLASHANVLHECMFFIDEREDIKQDLKRKFTQLKRSLDNWVKHFEKEFLNPNIEGMEQVKAIHENYNDEFSEMIYEHLDVIKNYAPYRELFPAQKKFDVKKIQGLKTKKAS
ncbi:hypothetical protein ACQ1PF_07990 [Ornithobacterium rhinotracheale]